MEYNTIQNSINNKILNQEDSIFYIFEIVIKYLNNKTIKLRKIKNTKIGQLIDFDENITNNISKIKFTIFNINDPLNTMIIKKKFTNELNDFFIISDEKIIFQIISDNHLISCKYKFL